MLTTDDLRDELLALAKEASAQAEAVKKRKELDAAPLAEAFMASRGIRARMAKLTKLLTNGKAR